MHKLLERHLRRFRDAGGEAPPGIQPLLDAIDGSLTEADEDRRLMERSLDLTSQELVDRNVRLAHELAELERTKVALQASEARHRLIVETSIEGIWLLDAGGKTTYANDALAGVLGVPVEHIEGRPVTDFIEGEEAGTLRGRLLAGKPMQAVDLRLRRPDGSDAWVLASSAPLSISPAGPPGALVMVSDITARRRAEEALRAAYRELKEQDRFRTQFLNNTAHELATPLTPMILQVDVLRRSLPAGSPLVEQVAVIDRNIKRLAQLVNDVLDASKLQAGRLHVAFETTDIAQITREAVQSFQPLAQQAGIDLTCEPPAPVLVRGDRRRLSQVLYNLLSNALKFTPPGGSIQVRCLEATGTAQVVVHDTGIGLTQEAIGRLFQPFSQVHDTMQRTKGGTGLGLYISRAIVEEHAGHIWAESQGVGLGATFTFELPVMRDMSGPSAPARAEHAAPAPQAKPPASKTASRSRKPRSP